LLEKAFRREHKRLVCCSTSVPAGLLLQTQSVRREEKKKRIEGKTEKRKESEQRAPSAKRCGASCSNIPELPPSSLS